MQRLACSLIPNYGGYSLVCDANTCQRHTTQSGFCIQTNNKTFLIHKATTSRLPYPHLIIIIHPLTARVAGAPQMISQPVSSISLFSTALWDLANSRSVHSMILSSHLFFCLPCLLLSFTVPCKMVLPRPDVQEYKPLQDHTAAICVSLRWSGLHVVQLPAGSWHGLSRWYHALCMRCVVSCGSTSFPWLVFFFRALL